MPDRHDGTTFLRWALPRLGLDWRGYRKVRGQVLTRIRRRLVALGLDDLAAYRERLVADPAEWRELDSFTDISISRFYRDARVFEWLASDALPALRARARAWARETVRIWCVGVASGEEPYTLALLDAFGSSGDAETTLGHVPLEILATDRDAGLLARARRGRYPRSSLRELPDAWRAAAFLRHGADDHELRPELRARVTFLRQDMRHESPAGAFDLVLCRNSAFMYLDEAGRAEMLARIHERLVPGGLLVVGNHDRLPGIEPGRGDRAHTASADGDARARGNASDAHPPGFEPVSGSPLAFRRASPRRSPRSDARPR